MQSGRSEDAIDCGAAAEVNAIEEQQLKQTQEIAAEADTMESNSFGSCYLADLSDTMLFLLGSTVCWMWTEQGYLLVSDDQYCIDCNCNNHIAAQG